MELINNGFFLFDQGLPVHTWYPVISGKEVNEVEFYSDINLNGIKKRALYFHIPFCEGNICSFCNFNRVLVPNSTIVDEYVNALIKEVEIKCSKANISTLPIHSIFFGGGTPSVLSADQIRKIGNCIKTNFNLSNLVEFSFENNINSITEAKVAALKDIGVTHVRAGVQTLNPKYRKYFNLTPTVEDIHNKVKLLNDNFSNVCIDIIYAINGQTNEELIKEIHHACALNTKLIDFYPLTQPGNRTKLYSIFSENNLKAKSELEIISHGIILKEVLKNYGYVSHNGHGFVKVPDGYVNEDLSLDKPYSFEYHKCTMGYDDGDVIGFGSGSNSIFKNYTTLNNPDINKYIDALKKDIVPCKVYKVDTTIHYTKGLMSHLPYFGYADKDKINFEKVDKETLLRLGKLIDMGIVIETKDWYKLRKDAWLWDNVLMYYLSPKAERDVIDTYIKGKEDFYTLSNISMLV